MGRKQQKLKGKGKAAVKEKHRSSKNSSKKKMSNQNLKQVSLRSMVWRQGGKGKIKGPGPAKYFPERVSFVFLYCEKFAGIIFFQLAPFAHPIWLGSIKYYVFLLEVDLAGSKALHMCIQYTYLIILVQPKKESKRVVPFALKFIQLRNFFLIRNRS